MEQFKNLNFKEKNTIIVLSCFGALFVAAILISILVFKQPIVAVCLTLLIEIGIAVCLHNVEIWIHGAFILIELIVGVLIPRVALTIILVIIYAAAICAMKFLFDENKSFLKK